MCSPQLSHSCKNSCSFAWDQPSDSEFSVIDTICRPLSTKRSRGSFDRSKHTNDAYASPILSSELSTVPQHRDHSSVSHTSDYSTGMSNRLPCEDSKSANDYDLLEWLEDCPSELFELYPSIDTLVTPEQRAGKFYQPTGIFQQSVNTDDHGNDDRMPPQDSMAQEVDLGSMTSTHSGCWMGALEATFEQENYAPSTSMMMDYDENNETFTKLSSIAVGGSARTPHVWTVADAEILRSHPTDPVGKFMRDESISAELVIELNLMDLLVSAPRKSRSKYGPRRFRSADELESEARERNRRNARDTRRRKKIFARVLGIIERATKLPSSSENGFSSEVL